MDQSCCLMLAALEIYLGAAKVDFLVGRTLISKL